MTGLYTGYQQGLYSEYAAVSILRKCFGVIHRIHIIQNNITTGYIFNRFTGQSMEKNGWVYAAGSLKGLKEACRGSSKDLLK